MDTENAIQQDSTPSQSVAPSNNSSKPNKIFWGIGVGALLGLGLLGGYLLWGNSLKDSQNLNQNDVVSPTQTVAISTPTIKKQSKDCSRDYSNSEHGFSLQYPCAWGNAKEEWTNPTSTGVKITGYELALSFSDENKLEAGGASNDFSAPRGGIYQDIRDKNWDNYLKSCSEYLICKIDKNSNSKIISRLILPYPFVISSEGNQLDVPQYFVTRFSKEALFDIYNAKISIVGFRYNFVANEDLLLAKLATKFPSYVSVTKKIESGATSVSLQEAQAYNLDLDKMKSSEISDLFDESTLKNLSDFDVMVSSFKFTK